MGKVTSLQFEQMLKDKRITRKYYEQLHVYQSDRLEDVDTFLEIKSDSRRSRRPKEPGTD